MPLNRHPALQDLSNDHHLFIAQAREVRLFLQDHDNAQELDDLIETLLDFWKSHGAPHCQEEEQVIYPFYVTHAPLKRRSIEALHTDHQWLREKVQELADLPRFENCSPLLRSIMDYMVNHVQHEERTIYDAIQDALNEEQLAELAIASLKFREKNRQAEDINRSDDYQTLPDLDF